MIEYIIFSNQENEGQGHGSVSQKEEDMIWP